MEVIIEGETKDLERFKENFDWAGIFNKFHCTIERETINENAILFTFGLPRHPILGIKTANESKLTEILEAGCVIYNLKMQ